MQSEKSVFNYLFEDVFEFDDDIFRDSLLQHGLVPILQALGFGNFLVRRVAMEDIVVTLRGRTGPNVCPDVTLVPRVLKIA